MGGIPKKALKESQLEKETVGAVVEDGSHQTYKVKFIEDSKTKHGFYKKLAPKKDYPALLAKISVATSLFKRLFQGKRSAEERLVFDENDKLVGTLSIGVDGFKPFNFSNESVPQDLNQKELLIPSTKTLIDANFMEILLGRWYLNDDDGHPHNMSLAGDIDFDMFFYWLTIYMKGFRVLIGVPNRRVNLSVEDWEKFPCVKDSKPYHWPTFKHPGKETIPTVLPLIQEQLLDKALPKVYADPTQFESLASEPKAQEQKFAAALKALLTFQPEMVRARLKEQFGDMPLDYASLDEFDPNVRIIYEEKFPEFFNKKSNDMPFVDFIMNIYQQHYDNLYRVVVFYMGCDNNGFGVPLRPTYEMLYRKPSFYKNVEKWIIDENEIHAKDDNSCKYNEKELLKRYHQIWRDAFAPILKELLHCSYNLTNKLLLKVSKDVVINEVLDRKVIDNDITSAWQIFGSFPELSKQKIEPLILVAEDSRLREALLLMVDFSTLLYSLSKSYYEKKRNDLTEEDNLLFITQIEKLVSTYNVGIRKSLAHTSIYAEEFNLIAKGLQQFSEQANFSIHLTTTDQLMKDVQPSIINKKELEVDNPEVLHSFSKFLFDWARGLNPETFNKLVLDIINQHYVSFLSNRNRAIPVAKYLKKTLDLIKDNKKSMDLANDNRLSYILCSGNEEGALNTLLIEHLTPIMMQTQYLPSIRTAVKNNTFCDYVGILTKSAVNYAKHEKSFVHLYSTEGANVFCKVLYDWIAKLDERRFKIIIESSLTLYEDGLSSIKSFFSGGKKTRRPEVQGYFELNNQARMIAMIFVKGIESSTLNSTLFDELMVEMKKDISKNKLLLMRPEYRLIMEYDAAEHKKLYLPKVKDFGVSITQQLENLSDSSFETVI